MKQRKGWRMNCDIGKVMEGLKNELCYDYNYELNSFSNLSVALPTSQLILQPFRRFTYVTVHSPTLPLLHVRSCSFSNSSFASPMSQLILQPFFYFSYVTSSSLNSPGEPPMLNFKGESFKVGYMIFIVFMKWEPKFL